MYIEHGKENTKKSNLIGCTSHRKRYNCCVIYSREAWRKASLALRNR